MDKLRICRFLLGKQRAKEKVSCSAQCHLRRKSVSVHRDNCILGEQAI